LTDNKKVIETTVANLEKIHGKNCVQQLGKNKAMKVSVIPTGVLSFDAATGVGGVPRGRVIEIFGPESSGKTTLALQIIAQAHATGGEAAFVDAEHALDPKYATALGVNVDQLWCSQPDNGEQALEITEGLVRTGAFDVIVVDSVAALVPKAELDGEFGDAQMGLQARLMSQAMRKLVGAVAKSKTCLIFINQMRDKIGVMFGSPETTTGGKALKFYSSMRIDTRKGAAVKDGDVVIGTMNRIKIVKNKVAAPFREAEVMMVYGHGYSQIHDLLKLAVEHGIAEKSGSWYSYKGERIGQGIDNAVAFLTENADLAQKVFNETRLKVMPPSEEEESK
jgi:recombination protein RecA